jgi:hypothetical protein
VFYTIIRKPLSGNYTDLHRAWLFYILGRVFLHSGQKVITPPNMKITRQKRIIPGGGEI